MEQTTKKDSFYHYINPVCLSVGVMAMAVHFEMNMLDVGLWGLGLWGFTGSMELHKEGRITSS